MLSRSPASDMMLPENGYRLKKVLPNVPTTVQFPHSLPLKCVRTRVDRFQNRRLIFKEHFPFINFKGMFPPYAPHKRRQHNPVFPCEGIPCLDMLPATSPALPASYFEQRHDLRRW